MGCEEKKDRGRRTILLSLHKRRGLTKVLSHSGASTIEVPFGVDDILWLVKAVKKILLHIALHLRHCLEAYKAAE